MKERNAAGKLPPAEATAIAQQAARGLLSAHKRGIIHRDVKPANIMVTTEGTVEILDFGLAKLAADQELTQTMGSGTPGTVAYVSPERADRRQVDTRTDLWSLGVTLYEMIAGERPFHGGSASAVVHAIRRSQAPRLEGIPRQLEDIVNRCLEKDREARYASADELLGDLERFQGGERLAGERAKRIAVSAATFCVAGIILGTMTYRSYKRQWARFDAVARARSLSGKGQYSAAFRLAEEVARILPGFPF